MQEGSREAPSPGGVLGNVDVPSPIGMRPLLEVDHINRDKCDCRMENLRVVTHRENCGNRGMPPTTGRCTSEGVCDAAVAV